MSGSNRKLTMYLLVVLLSLASRFAEATHPYEHDAVEYTLECEACLFTHVSDDYDAITERTVFSKPRVVPITRPRLVATIEVIRGQYPRGPPSLNSEP